MEKHSLNIQLANSFLLKVYINLNPRTCPPACDFGMPGSWHGSHKTGSAATRDVAWSNANVMHSVFVSARMQHCVTVYSVSDVVAGFFNGI
jgi:hypothetical protein